MNKIVNGVANDYEFNDIGYYQEINIPTKQIGKTFQVINMYEQKYKQLQSNWNSLRELLESEKKAIEEDELFCYLSNKDYIEFILDKMNELEGKDNNE